MMNSRNKKLVFFFVICILLSLGIAAYVNMRIQTEKQLEKYYRDIAGQEIRSVERTIQDIEQELHSISRSQAVQKALQNRYSNFLEASRDVEGSVETRFWYLTTSENSGIDEMELISFLDIPKVGYFIYGNSRLSVHEELADLTNDLKTFLYEKDGRVFLVYPVYQVEFLNTIGLIWVRLDLDYLWSPEPSGDTVLGVELDLNETPLIQRGQSAGGIQISAVGEKTGFSIRYTVKKPAILEGGLAMLILVILAGIAIWVLFLYYSKRLAGDYQAIMEEKKKQEYLQAMVLKAQISPHFLYNVMSMINWKAKYSGQEDISIICRELSDFYRTSLNKGREEITVRDELLNIESYLKLKQYLVEIPFTYEIKADEDGKDACIIGFILQPVVENAIIHGIGQLEKDGHILITVEKEAPFIRLKVRDNGKIQVSRDKLFANKSGYGIRNVDQRIRLKYGDDCGVFLNEDCEGTEVILKVRELPPEDTV